VLARARQRRSHKAATATLDAELRTALAEEVFPEFVEIEFERVMKVVFEI